MTLWLILLLEASHLALTWFAVPRVLRLLSIYEHVSVCLKHREGRLVWLGWSPL